MYLMNRAHFFYRTNKHVCLMNQTPTQDESSPYIKKKGGFDKSNTYNFFPARFAQTKGFLL